MRALTRTNTAPERRELRGERVVSGRFARIVPIALGEELLMRPRASWSGRGSRLWKLMISQL